MNAATTLTVTATGTESYLPVVQQCQQQYYWWYCSWNQQQYLYSGNYCSRHYLLYVVVSNGGCAVATSNTAQVIVNTAPSITGQPLTTQTKCQGIAATALTVTATGTNLTYQWFSNPATAILVVQSVGTNSNTYTPVTTNCRYYLLLCSSIQWWL